MRRTLIIAVLLVASCAPDIDALREIATTRIAVARGGCSTEQGNWAAWLLHEEDSVLVRASITLLISSDRWALPALKELVRTRDEPTACTAVGVLWKAFPGEAAQISREAMLSTPEQLVRNCIARELGLHAVQSSEGDDFFRSTCEEFLRSEKGMGWGLLIRATMEGPAHSRVMHICPDSPAMHSGLRPGDIITHVDHQPFSDHHEILRVLRERNQLHMTVMRNGVKHEVALTR